MRTRGSPPRAGRSPSFLSALLIAHVKAILNLEGKNAHYVVNNGVMAGSDQCPWPLLTQMERSSWEVGLSTFCSSLYLGSPFVK